MAADTRSTPTLDSGFRLRPLVASDLERLVELHAQLDSSSWNRDAWQDSLRSPYQSWGLEHISQPGYLIAYSVYILLPDEAELVALGVDARWQERGLGCSLLFATLQLLPDCASRCLLEVRQSNRPARNLYEKLGFQMIGRRKNYYPVPGGGVEDALVMDYLLHPD